MGDIYIHKGDLPKDLSFEPSVAVDTETMGLVIPRDRLCTVQLSSGDGTAHIVQLGKSPFDCPNLRAVLVSPFIEKIFHFARFDLAALRFHLGVECNPVFCTKIASKLCRTYTDRHGLKDLCRELLGTNLSKEQQSSDWGAKDLSADQKSYAAADVLYLHDLRHKLSEMLIRENRLDLAQSCFRFLPHRATLDLQGWSDIDIFEH